MLTLVLVGVSGLATLSSLAGCGGSGDKDAQSASRRAPRSAEVPPPRLAAVDRRAYAVIQKASGDLRAAAIPVTYGSAAQIPAGQLHSDLRRLDTLKPRNPLLKRLHAETARAVTSLTAQRSASSAHASAKAAIAEADRIDAGLRRYAASHPAANEIAPG